MARRLWPPTICSADFAKSWTISSAYYLLGYQSTNPAADGRWRRIDVKVKQPNVDVSARRGYLAFTADMVKAEADARNRPARESVPRADEALERLGRTRADARAFLSPVPTGSGLEVVVELASREIEGGRFHPAAPVTVTAAPNDEGPPVSVEGRIPAGARRVVVTIPLTTPPERTWQVSLRMTRVRRVRRTNRRRLWSCGFVRRRDPGDLR